MSAMVALVCGFVLVAGSTSAGKHQRRLESTGRGLPYLEFGRRLSVSAAEEAAVRSVHESLDYNDDLHLDFCSWSFVSCMDDGYEISIPEGAATEKKFQNVFSGEFPTLTGLYVKAAGFEGMLPESLSTAVGMKVFKVESNQISGTLPVE